MTLPRRQERCVLAVLLLEADHVVPMSRLCELLWDGDPPEHAPRTVRTYVARLRSLLGAAEAAAHGVELRTEHGGYRLAAPPDLLDAHVFRRLYETAVGTADIRERDRLLRRALDLWRGPALSRAATDRLRERLCAGLDELRLQAVEESLATGIELGNHLRLLPEVARQMRENPLRERLVELYMRALYRSGRRAEALEAYARARDLLSDQLGLEPGSALQRLQLEVLRDAAPPPAAEPVVGPPPLPAPAQLPASAAGFTGRAAQLAQLDGFLRRAAAGGGAPSVIAVAGTAGVGKTTLAIHWAHRIRGRFPDGQLYLDLRGFDPTGSAVDPASALRRLIEALDVPPDRVPGDLDAAAAFYRTLVADRKILVVLDNARDADQVRQLLPGTPGCLAVVTSRNHLAGLVATAGAVPLTLDLLSPEEARELLARRLGADRTAIEPDAVEEIIARCVRLPLALAIVAAHGSIQPGLSLRTLADRLRDAGTTAGATLDALRAGDEHTDRPA